MKRFNKAIKITGLSILAAGLVYTLGCRKSDDHQLGALPVADFTITAISGMPNTYLLTSTSTGAFLYQWNDGNGTIVKEGQLTDTVYYKKAGTYHPILIAMGNGGYDTVSHPINVATTDNTGCTGNEQLLTNCDSLVWKLNPDAGALTVGPADGSIWWSSSAADVATRSCLFNDEYTFRSDGSFKFDDKGDFWVDDESGAPYPADIGQPIGCTASSNWPTQYAAWGSGEFSFDISSTKMKVTGLGAHIGLYKVGEANTATAPESVVTYDVTFEGTNKMILTKKYDWGYWKVVLLKQ